MSNRVNTLVWNCTLPCTERFVLLKLSDTGDDDGTQVRPSIGRIADDCGLHERTVQRLLRAWVKSGLLIVVAEGGGRRPTNYRIDLDRLLLMQRPARRKHHAPAAGPLPEAPATPARGGATPPLDAGRGGRMPPLDPPVEALIATPGVASYATSGVASYATLPSHTHPIPPHREGEAVDKSGLGEEGAERSRDELVGIVCREFRKARPSAEALIDGALGELRSPAIYRLLVDHIAAGRDVMQAQLEAAISRARRQRLAAEGRRYGEARRRVEAMRPAERELLLAQVNAHRAQREERRLGSWYASPAAAATRTLAQEAVDRGLLTLTGEAAA